MTMHYGKNLLPSTVGFDNLLSTLEEFDRILNSGKTPQTYPPHNVVKFDDNNYEIQIAVAGFSIDDIDVEVKNNVLTVNGSLKKPELEVEYLHHGLASRDFNREFKLNDSVVVKSANIENGILKIQLENIIPEEKRPRKIQIGFVERPLLTDKK